MKKREHDLFPIPFMEGEKMGEKRLPIIASRDGYSGEKILVHKVDKGAVYMTIDKTRNWYPLSYEVVPDGTYNQSVKGMALPYVICDRDVYSIDSFFDWMDRKR